jgi:nucleoside-diphosphate-sugar epimerase
MTGTLLVTGSSGFIGSWLVRKLTADGHRVVGLDLVAPPQPADLDDFIACDIRNAAALAAALKAVSADAVVHLAARTDLKEARDIGGYAANVDGVKNLIAAVRLTPSVRRVIYTSSQLVCRVGHVPVGDSEYCPNTLYGRSKVLTETIVREHDGGGVEWCLVRPTTVWGPGMSPHYQSLLRFIRQKRYFHCGRARLFKSYVYAQNIAYQYAQLLAADAARIHRATFYLSDYLPLSLRDYTDGLARELGAPAIPTLPLPLARLLARAGDLLNACGMRGFPFNSFRLNNILTEYVFDLSRTEAVCGPLPCTQEEGIKATALWYLSIAERRDAGDAHEG